MKIIYSIELSPYSYSKEEYQYPNKSSKELPKEWTEYWYKCLADSGIKNLQPIKTGSFFVDLDTIDDEELAIIVKKEIEKISEDLSEEELSNLEESVHCIEGGIVIIDENNVIIEPRCCTDLGDLSGWEDIFSKEENNWEQLWIGHPWIYYKKTTEFIEFSAYTELNLSDFYDIKAVNRFPTQWLRNEIDKAKISRARLEKRVLEILLEMNINNPINIAKILTGNRDNYGN